MSIFAFKIIALLTMFIDHSAAVFCEAVETPLLSEGTEWIMHMVGRIAFPLYAFMIVEGVRHTKNWRKYALRILGLGILSQFPYAFTLNGWVGFSDMPWWRRITDLNILFTLTLGVILLAFLASKRFDRFLNSRWTALVLLGAIILFYLESSNNYTYVYILIGALILSLMSNFTDRLRPAAGQAVRLALFLFPLFWFLHCNFSLLFLIEEKIHFSFDYDIYALCLFAALFWAKTPRHSAVVIAAWSLWCYFGDWKAIIFAALSAVLVGLYNGKKGINDHRLFYFAYPAHLFLLWGLLIIQMH